MEAEEGGGRLSSPEQSHSNYVLIIHHIYFQTKYSLEHTLTYTATLDQEKLSLKYLNYELHLEN